MKRIGIAFSGGPGPAEIVKCVKLAEALGYESAWIAEGHGGDQFSILTACAVQTSTILLGTAISSVFVRSIPTIAMAAATVDDISGGRFILGLGSSHRVQVEPEHGIDYSKPITRVRESVNIIKMLLRDGVVQYKGETITIQHFDLWFSPGRKKIPIYLAGLFPKMISTCGELADGLILTRSTLTNNDQIRQWIAAGASRCGRRSADIDVASLLPAALSDNRSDALNALRPGLAFYLGFFPRYNRLLAEYGFVEESAQVADAWARGDKAAATHAVTDEMIEATSVVGTRGQCREQIEAYRESGIDLPIISPFARGPDSRKTFEAVIRACAPR